MTLKINPIVATLLIAGILILLIALIKGCNSSRKEVIAKEKAIAYGDSMKAAFNVYKIISDSSKKQFQDSLEFSAGQLALANEQKLRTEAELQDITKQNRALIAQHRLYQYADTTAITVPNGFVTECEGCFVKLENTTNLVERYKRDIKTIETKQADQNQLYQKRFKELDQEKLGFYNKINTLAKAQQEAIDKLKPHGRLYLTWGVLWRPWPVGAGGGLMYQNKRNLIWGLTCYYGQNGTTLETNIHFPLSLKFR
jgi:hypothetical protein